MTTTTMTRSGGPFGTGLSSSMLAAASALIAAMARFYRTRQGRRMLQSMPNYLLHDLGISRSEIDVVTEFGRARGGRW